MEFLAIIMFVGILALIGFASLMWGYDSHTNDDTLRRWK